MLEIILVVILVLLLLGGGWGYSRRDVYGPAPYSLVGALLVVILVVLLFRVL